MKPRRLAAIDVGTNTVLLLIAESKGPGDYRIIEDRAEITRLGEGVHRSGSLGDGGRQRTLDALKMYCARCHDLGVGEIRAAGTSALREADNAGRFIRQVKAELGLELRALSSREEAYYSFAAVERGLPPKGRQVLVVDVGGGSTELIWGRLGTLYRWASLPVGTVKLTERFLFSDPAEDGQCRRLTAAVDKEIHGDLLRWSDGASFDAMVGVAGTFTTLAAVSLALPEYRSDLVHGSELERTEVQRQIELFKTKTLEERKRIPGLEPKRADVILAGALLIDRIMERFQLERASVSDQGIRYGLLYEALSGTPR